MFVALRQRMLLAVSLTCAAAPSAACKKEGDGDVTSVEKEKVKKPKKPDPEEPAKKEKSWVPVATAKPTPCTWAKFCSTNPAKKPDLFDGGGLYVPCGSGAKIPESVAVKGFEGRDASLDPVTTEEARKEEPDACCYSYQTHPCGKGRPIRHNDALVLAPEIARTGWGEIDVAAAARELAATPERIAHYREVARLEHGSVAAFANLSLELMTLGAPASLIEAAHVAALDEIRHARIFWSLVEALGGGDLGPGAMTIPREPVDVDRMLVATVIEGCVGETLGSLLFFEIGNHLGGALGGLYRTIAEEEATHAELAFRVVRFLVGTDPRRAALAVDAAARAPRMTSSVPDLHEATQRAVIDRAFAEVVMPALESVTHSIRQSHGGHVCDNARIAD
jgi:hypothetical protein